MEYALSGDDRPDALEQRVRALRSVQLNRPVGQAYEYSNAGYMILGLLVQQISGQPYEAYMREHLFAPLEMRQTFTDWTRGACPRREPAATATGLVYRWPASCPSIAPTCRPVRTPAPAPRMSRTS